MTGLRRGAAWEPPAANHLSRRAVLQIAGAAGASAMCGAAPNPDKAFSLSEIASGVYVHEGAIALPSPGNGGDTANLGFVAGRDAVAVIDAGGSYEAGAAFREAIRRLTDRPVRYVLFTHMHPDHVLGAAAFADDKPEFVAHHKLARGFAARADRYLAAARETLGAAFEGTTVIPPARPVEGTLEIDLGGRKLLLEAHPTAHTDNDLTVRDAESGTLFLGDLLFARHVPVLDGSLKGWLAFVDRARTWDAARAVPGHGPASLPWPVALDAQRDYLTVLATDVRDAIKSGRSLSDALDTAGKGEAAKWSLFDAYHPRNVTAAYAELEWE